MPAYRHFLQMRLLLAVDGFAPPAHTPYTASKMLSQAQAAPLPPPAKRRADAM